MSSPIPTAPTLSRHGGLTRGTQTNCGISTDTNGQPRWQHEATRTPHTLFTNQRASGTGTSRWGRGCFTCELFSKAHLEERVKEVLEQSVGQQPDAVICNGDLSAAIGARQRCALVVGQDKLGVTVTVTDVVDTDIKFDIQVDRKPMV